MSSIFKTLYDYVTNLVTTNELSQAVENSSSAAENEYKNVSVALPLPLDVIEIILSHVPDDDLLQSCVFVEQWKDIIDGNIIWLLKCLRKWKRVVRPDPLPKHFYCYLHKMPFGVNLIQNPCGKSNLDKWTVTKNNGDGWRIEQPPDGADPIPNADCQYCFATSFGRCEKYQLINLDEWNVTMEMMNIVKPEIHISEWHSARFDCGSKYHLEISLMDETFKLLDRFQYDHTETQWTGREWKQVQNIFKDYPEGVKFIMFMHHGKDMQFWKGYYGSKMAEASVKLIMPT